MPDCMMPFPEDWHDFLKDYSFDDSQEVYTNGSRLIPVFRLEQLIKHLLKAQEPRVMTLREVLSVEVVYAEDIDKVEIIPVLVSRRAHDRIVLVRAHLMGSLSHVFYPLISEYGKRWRCWTSRPDEKRRAETSWN